MRTGALIFILIFTLPFAAAQKRTQTKRGAATTKPPAKSLTVKSGAKLPAKSPAAQTAAKPSSSSRVAATKASSKILHLRTEPNAVVWIDEVRRGVTNAEGSLEVKNVAAGRRFLRVRAKGFQERTLTLAPTERGIFRLPLTRTTDEAELAFQEAEEASAKAAGEEGRQKVVELYRRALALRPRFPAAHVGLARVLLASGATEDALEEIAAARRLRPVYPEASAVEGRILRAAADDEAAIESYRRAIREGRGFQPEAHAGLGILLEERGDYEGATEAFRKALAQLSDTEPALYQLLGASYEKLERWKEALAAYEKYLELAPEGKFASAINSIIDQLRVQAAEQQESAPPNH